MKIIFLGTPDFAVNILNSILESKHQVVGVVCQQDKPSGRGNKLTPPKVKIFANEKGLKVYQFSNIKTEGVKILKELNADIMVTAAYGQILSQDIISLCPKGIINVHGSLLPKYRGASPIQQAIINDEQFTGVTIMKTDIGIDTGDILLSSKCNIEDEDTYETLSEKLSIKGGRLCVEALDLIEKNKAIFTPQNHADATFTKTIKKEDCIIDFNNNSRQILKKVNALNPNPIAFFVLNQLSFKVYKVKPIAYKGTEKNGTIISANSKQGLIIKCKDGAVEIVEMTAPASKKMLAKAYLNGKTLQLGSVCNE